MATAATHLFSAGQEAALDELMAMPCRLVDQGGPVPAEDAAFLDWLDHVNLLVNSGQLEAQSIVDFWRSLGSDYLSGSLQGHALAKPHGYAGDFEMMEKIYGFHTSSDPRFRNWDRFFQQQAAVTAVRNRASYFSEAAAALLARRGAPLRILDLGCGPALHLAGWLRENPAAAVEILCIDHDSRAIERALTYCQGLGDRVRFQEANVLRFSPKDRYDLIWSSGLFDYLSDASFSRLAKRFRAAVRPGGEVVIGNFGVDNSSRPYMELVGDWRLNYRREDDLLKLAAQIAPEATEARVGRDDTGVNLFLHIGADAGA
jgi:extracellular factor (EF) 3-hydroxypalmitic acid methyl ester biosynthesis protein